MVPGGSGEVVAPTAATAAMGSQQMQGAPNAGSSDRRNLRIRVQSGQDKVGAEVGPVHDEEADDAEPGGDEAAVVAGGEAHVDDDEGQPRTAAEEGVDQRLLLNDQNRRGRWAIEQATFGLHILQVPIGECCPSQVVRSIALRHL